MQYLGVPINDYGKAPVMAMANNNILPSYNKYNGVAEWANAIFLWVNLSNDSKPSDAGEYPNKFQQNGQYITWYGGSRMYAGERLVVCHHFTSSFTSLHFPACFTSHHFVNILPCIVLFHFFV